MLLMIDDVFLLLAAVLLAGLLVYTVISGISIVQNTKSRKKLRQENADLLAENHELRTKLAQWEGQSFLLSRRREVLRIHRAEHPQTGAGEA